MLVGLLEPQPASVRAATRKIATASVFIDRTSFGFFSDWRHPRGSGIQTDADCLFRAVR
jgi:hypothetical protein